EQAVVAEKSNSLTRAILAAVRAEGGTPRFVHKSGTSDMNVVAAEWACPIVAYGPGDSSLDHTPHEHINLDGYLRAVRVLRMALQTLVDQAESGELAETATSKLSRPPS
ncbi:MAG: M20/M25/M40 family metallo-hydrolase, partial [Chloroflexi bacterium]|nr:M20/M25/M40 family metallo-hydrolase [Chloroflexota bacterium]